MCDGENLLLCYNRGCAVKFDPVNNPAGIVLYLNSFFTSVMIIHCLVYRLVDVIIIDCHGKNRSVCLLANRAYPLPTCFVNISIEFIPVRVHTI